MRVDLPCTLTVSRLCLLLSSFSVLPDMYRTRPLWLCCKLPRCFLRGALVGLSLVVALLLSGTFPSLPSLVGLACCASQLRSAFLPSIYTRLPLPPPLQPPSDQTGVGVHAVPPPDSSTPVLCFAWVSARSRLDCEVAADFFSPVAYTTWRPGGHAAVCSLHSPVLKVHTGRTQSLLHEEFC